VEHFGRSHYVIDRIQNMYTRGEGGEGPKITGIIFLKLFIRFYTITTLVSFKYIWT